MRLFVCYASENKEHLKFVSDNQLGIIPRSLLERDIIKKENLRLSIGAHSPNKEPLETYLRKKIQGVDAVCLLIDLETVALNDALKVSCFVAGMNIGVAPLNYKNSFAKQFSKILLNFAMFSAEIKPTDGLQAMCLPLRNFKDASLANLALLFANNTTDNLFPRLLGTRVASIKKLRRPMPEKNPNEKYFVDQDEKYFAYGSERHSSISEGEAHNDFCVLSGNLRFGWKIPNDQHYNMQKLQKDKTIIFGDFEGCHGQVESVPQQSHVNIFASDFMEYKTK